MEEEAGAYLRISRARTDDGRVETLGVERQLPPVVAMFERKGWKLQALDQGMTVEEIIEAIRQGRQVPGVFVDNDLSAYSGKRRPAFEAMVEAAQEGHIAGIGAWHPDRLSRDPDRDNIRIIDLHDRYGVRLATALAGDHDLATPAGRMMFRQLGILARYESEHRAERMRNWQKQRAEAGLWNGGRRPYGFEPDRHTHRAEEAARVREAAERLVGGEGLRAILRSWEQQGVLPADGKQWSTTTLRRILVSPRVAGLREHKGQVSTAVWAPILDQAAWLAVRRILLEDPARRQKAGRAPSYLLVGGLAVCGYEDCGQPLRSRPRQGVRGYACLPFPTANGCGRIKVLAEPLERWVIANVIDALSDPESDRLGEIMGEDPASEDAKLARQIEDDEAALSDLARARYTDRTLKDDRLYNRLAGELRDRIEATSKRRRRDGRAQRLANLPRGRVELERAFAERSIDWQRATISDVVEKVRVLPARRGVSLEPGTIDTDRVKIDWRV
jgi:site-specific DNA recombinase